MRINNLEFRKCSYLCTPPEHIGWEICKWEPNNYYKQEDKFIKDGEFYYSNDKSFLKIHKDCFKSPEMCYQIASWHWDDGYEFSFCGNRPVTSLDDSEWKDFKELIIFGFKQLSDESSSDW